MVDKEFGRHMFMFQEHPINYPDMMIAAGGVSECVAVSRRPKAKHRTVCENREWRRSGPLILPHVKSGPSVGEPARNLCPPGFDSLV